MRGGSWAPGPRTETDQGKDLRLEVERLEGERLAVDRLEVDRLEVDRLAVDRLAVDRRYLGEVHAEAGLAEALALGVRVA